MAEAEATPAATGGVPQTFGQKVVFGIPAIIVALVLAIGISYGILYAVNNGTREELTKKFKDDMAEADRKNGEKFKGVEEANTALKKDVATLAKATKDLEEARQLAALKLDEVGKNLTKVADEFGTFTAGQKTLDETQNKDLAKHEKNINEMDRKLHYIEDKLKKIDELASDVNGLKGDTSELKGQYTALRSDMTKVSKQADITENDLADLSERARLFQLRVLAARAREAADAARQLDLKNLLNRLDDVEDK